MKLFQKILTLGPDNEMLKTALTLQAPKYNLVQEENVKVIQFQDGRTVLGGLARDVHCTVYSFDHDLTISYFHFEY